MLVFKIYGENYEKYDKLRKQYEREEFPKQSSSGIPEPSKPSNRPLAMRAWLNKWDPEFNTQFKSTGTKSDGTNN